MTESIPSPPAPSPYYPPPLQPHSHNSYKIAIVVLLVVAISSSSATAYVYQMRTSELNSQIQRTSDISTQNANLQKQISQLQGQISQLQAQVSQLQSQLASRPTVQLIWLTGTVDISPNSGTPLWIFFDNQDTGTVSSAVFGDDSYQLWIQIGKAYTVRIYWDESFSGIQFCSTRPGIFTPTEATITQDFVC